MLKSESNRFMPDYAVHPGEILEETLSARNMKKSELAERCQLSAKTISQIIGGKAPITPETAIRFERVLGVSANIWNNLDAYFRLHIAKKADRRSIQGEKGWVNRFPVAELAKRGFISKRQTIAEMVEGLLDFFGVGSVEAWEVQFSRILVSYRRSPAFKSSKESVAAWLRIGEIMAEEMETDPFDRKKFKSALNEIRSLTIEGPDIFEPQMKELCCKAGVALVFVSEFPKTRLSGATRWLRPDKALIMLSLRHKRDDHFWFTFFHEAGHILLHGKTVIFVDEEDMDDNSAEDKANRFAANTLIPAHMYKAFIQRGRFYKEDILAFARAVGISPGIVVGRLQRENKIKYNWHNNMTHKFKLKE